MSDIPLKPCPFCGADPEIENNSYDDADGINARYSYECSDLKCPSLSYYQSHQEAAEAWNKRVTNE